MIKGFLKILKNWKKLVDNNSSVDAVQLVPDGIIKYIYPIKGNEAALNYDILHTKDVKQEAQKSIDTKIIYFAGPLHLKQGVAIIGRLPVFKNNKFWGFSAVIIRLETLIKTLEYNRLISLNITFNFKKNLITGKEEFFFPNTTDFSKNIINQ